MFRVRTAVALALVVACGKSRGAEDEAPPPAASYEWQLPAGFPVPAVPADNPMSVAKVELGRHLFHDSLLSLDRIRSCASCHTPETGFAEAYPVSVGATGEFTPRNSMSLTNVAYNSSYTWHDPREQTLESQLVIPMFGDDPIELGLTPLELERRLRSEPDYPSRFRKAFPGEVSPVTSVNAIRALASFVRTMISGQSAYDRAMRGEVAAMSAAARRGETLFRSERLKCDRCHGGFNFTNATRTAENEPTDKTFFNTGLYNIDEGGSYPAPNRGLEAVTQRPRDRGRFRVPTLRNIALSAPYLHDGSAATLDEVISIYATGGRLIESGADAGDGRRNPHKSKRVGGFELTSGERADLLAFLAALTDESFVRDPRFQNPATARD